MNRDYPILIFPSPTEPVDRSTLGGGNSKLSTPSIKKNAQRITPKLKELVKVIEERQMSIRQGAEGVNPEDVLVLETAGRIDEFYKAIQKIEGFEWLLEEDFDGIADEDFYVSDQEERPTDKALASRLYLVSTNTTSLKKLVTLYNSYVANNDMVFDLGYAGFKNVFKQLRDIRFWDYQDRLDGTNFLEEWLNNNEAFSEVSIKFQIELWYRSDPERRAEAQATVEKLVQTSGGRVISSCTIAEIRYHALLVEVPIGALRLIVNDLEDGSLIKCRDIMYFKPLPQAIRDQVEESDLMTVEEDGEQSLPNGDPVVALFDGYPLVHHRLLNGRLRIDDPDDVDGKYQANQRKHGTEMASLIIHGDLSRHEEPIDSPLYVRPIMAPDENGGELVPEDRLAVDLIHSAVKRMFEGEDGSTPTAPSVKIINFSIGDPVRVFHHLMSPMARLLDWLSYKYNVLFIISAGNGSQRFPIGCSLTEFKAKGQEAISRFVTRELLSRRIENRILSPAESINNLTVGSIHRDATGLQTLDSRVNPYDCLHPAIYSPFGGGMKNAVKPDLVYDGGRQLLEEILTDRSSLTPSCYKIKPGIQAAFPDSTLDKKVFERGTSCSTALISRHAYHCFKTMHELLESYNLPETHIHLLVKALTVHGCSWTQVGDNIKRFLSGTSDKKEVNAVIRQWIGYGYPEFEKSLFCNKQRVTVVGFSELKCGKAHVYNLPLPTSLQGRKIRRRLTVTLAWMSPIVPQNQKYRKARLWFETTDNSEIADNRMDITQYQAVRRGTLQHEVFEEERRYPYGEDDTLGIKINCAEDACSFEEPIKYAIAVSLEFGEGVQLELFDNIYEDIREKLRPRIPIITEIL